MHPYFSKSEILDVFFLIQNVGLAVAFHTWSHSNTEKWL